MPLYNDVIGQVNSARSGARDAFDEAMLFLQRLEAFIPSIISSTVSQVQLDQITAPIDSFHPPVSPVPPTLTLTLPTFPDSYVPGAIASIDYARIGTLPEFNIPDPVLNLPTAPGVLNVSPPGAPQNINTSFDFPDAPSQSSLALPPVPTFLSYNIPVAPTVVIPEFNQALPVYSGLPVPGLIAHWQETLYTDDLLSQVKEELLSRVKFGGTGLHQNIERAIWDRARDREEKVNRKAIDTMLVEVASRGLRRPQGATFAGMEYLLQESQNKLSDLSREIAIKQADLEQENLKFSIQQSIQLEQILLGYHEQVQARAWEVQKVTQEFAISLYKANVEMFQVQLATYSAYSTAFQERVKAELAKTEVFKAQIEAEGLKSQLNEADVKLYLARIDGIKSTVDIYKTQVSAVEAQVQAESLKIQNYKALVDAYGAQVSAKRDEYGAYSDQIKAELAKTEVYDTRVKAFVSRIQAYSTQLESEIKKVDSSIEVEKMRLQEYLGRFDAIVKQAQTQQAFASAAVDVFKGQAALYSAETSAESSRFEAGIKSYELLVKTASIEAEVALKNAEIQLKNLDSHSQLLLESMKAGASVSTQLAAASLAGINISAQVQGQSSDSNNTNHNYNYEM